MLNGFIKVLIIIFTVIFSVACGLLLVRFLIPLYFKILSPIPQTLSNFYITVGVFALLVVLLDFVFFKMGKYNWGILITGTAVLLLLFGIPIFMLENNNMLWQQAVVNKSGPVYFIDFSDESISSMKYFQDIFTLIWDRVYWYVYAGIIIYPAGYFYLRKLDWRIGGVRIKL
ncbi:MAG: hypothetical protein CVU52_02295 [Deltaproteobacteria bacterium HGW-Deltaproteobacteria-10]|nr:MAG: hypothetical protein CVU52_02295 [Deltaproteobacteria bacterium HGW-Deltaproteobacteria-10]